MAQLAQTRRAALLLDYDGTLAAFRKERHRAVPYPGVSALLRRIMETGRTRVAIITGRRAEELVLLLGIFPHPEVWGSHGLQRLKPDGSCDMPRIDESLCQSLIDAVLWLEHVGLRHRAELKPGGIAVHWRGLPGSAVPEVKDRVLQGWAPLAYQSHMSLLEFDGGFEIRVPGRTKANAVRSILAEMEEDVPVAYLGDDQTDEEAFLALRHRGLAVLVRPEWRETAADLWLKPPQELLDFLAQWLQTCRGAGPPEV